MDLWGAVLSEAVCGVIFGVSAALAFVAALALLARVEARRWP